ncbi:hypothetical protein BHE74_00047146 [Ensete ventricosum]|nr:hypothetical protein BHE74_00047146 [Ensete ventricosum]
MAEMLRFCAAAGLIRCREAPVAAAECRGRRRCAAVRCSSRAIPGQEAADVAAASRLVAGVVAADGAEGKGLAERLRLGSLVPDGLSYKESFVVRCYEVGINKTATVETIANLLQSVGFSTDGFATTPTMRKLRLIWVTSRMHIEIYKYPAWWVIRNVHFISLNSNSVVGAYLILLARGDVVEIETWCQGEGRIGTRRDWILKDLATGEVIGRATRYFVGCT